MDREAVIARRASGMDVSGIRKIFEAAGRLRDPINLSVGQPDFPVPDELKRAAHEAIDSDRNGYTVTRGIPELRSRIVEHLRTDIGWEIDSDLRTHEDADRPSVLVTSGTSGALLLLALATLDEGDEYIIPDPYFVLYPAIGQLTGGRAVACDTYPDFRLTAQRVEPLITERTKFVLSVSPANPTGVVTPREEARELLELCRDRGVVLVSDEIYDEFAFEEELDPSPVRGRVGACPSPARFAGAEDHVLVIRGFGKTYGCTGWRMGYVCGPGWLVREMTKMQQFSFVCAPSMAQWACADAFGVDMSGVVREYAARRDMVLERLGGLSSIPRPGGAFYAFVEVPGALGITGSEFAEQAMARNVLVIPGGAFSERDTHFRLSFATSRDKLEPGLEILASLMRGE
ncbi:MAG: pyridoxal phosphate-dependent aminotransferase [Phycisphaerales bacterium JB043]